MKRDPRFVYTEVRATRDEERRMREAYAVPVITGNSGTFPEPGQVVHEIALEHGLQDIVGFYGYDFTNRRFVHLPGADVGEPDTWK